MENQNEALKTSESSLELLAANEQAIEALYMEYARQQPEKAAFWLDIANDEHRHSALIEGMRPPFTTTWHVADVSRARPFGPSPDTSVNRLQQHDLATWDSRPRLDWPTTSRRRSSSADTSSNSHWRARIAGRSCPSCNARRRATSRR